MSWELGKRQNGKREIEIRSAGGGINDRCESRRVLQGSVGDTVGLVDDKVILSG